MPSLSCGERSPQRISELDANDAVLYRTLSNFSERYCDAYPLLGEWSDRGYYFPACPEQPALGLLIPSLCSINRGNRN